MASESGYSNQKKLGLSQFKTIQTLGSEKFGSATANRGLYAFELGLTVDSIITSLGADLKPIYTLEIVANNAKVNDVVRVMDGDFVGMELIVQELAGANFVRVLPIVDLLTGFVGSSVDICRWVTQGLDASGNVIVTPPAGGATEAKQDVQIVEETAINTKLTTLNAKDFATSAKQDTQITAAGATNTKLDTLIAKDFATTAKQDLLLAELQLKADLTETQPVSVASLPLPTGAATSAKQDLLLAELQLKADLTETQPVSAASLPLPAGAATSANQALEITELQDIEADVEAMSAKLPATLGQKAMAASLAVAISSDQSAIPVTQTPSSVAGTITTARIGVGLSAVRATVAGTAPNAARKKLMVKPSKNNTGTIYIGASGVATTTGLEIIGPDRLEFEFDSGDYYLISDVAAQEVDILEKV